MIQATTLNGTKDILMQYGNDYCIIYEKLKNILGYWLVETIDIENCVDHNELASYHHNISKYSDYYYWDYYGDFIYYLPEPLVHIPELIMMHLINTGFVLRSMSDKEWLIQKALGTAPVYRPYIISEKVIST